MSNRFADSTVRGALLRVQTVREDAKTNLERARQEANSKLAGVAGPNYAAILTLI